MKKKQRKFKVPDLSRAKLYASRLKRERQPKAMDYEQAVQDLPRITNETVAEHREEVLGSARKFIYPLSHSKKRIVVVSSTIFVAVLVGFVVYIMLALYSFQSTSTFVYRVTQIVPLPVARADGKFVSYESYLFQLRHYMHYYETQQKVDFASERGKEQLENYRKQALEQVTDRAYTKQLAKERNISVTDKEVAAAITLMKNQNRLGSSDQVLEDVLKEFWGWSMSDFKRELREQLLAQKVAAALDTETNRKASEALGKLQAGSDFAAIAKAYSADPAAQQTGGEYPASVDESSRDVAPQAIQMLRSLQPGQISGIVNTGTSLEIVKLINTDGDKMKAAHIVLPLKPISTYVDPLKKENKPSYYIKQQ